MRASNPPPTPDSMPAWTCTPGPCSSASSTATARAASPQPARRPGTLPPGRPALPRRDRRRLRVHALLAPARRPLPRPRHRLRPRTRLGHESRPRLQNQGRPARRRGHRPAPQGRRLPPRLRLPQERRGLRALRAACAWSANAPSCTATSTPRDARPTCPPSPATSSTSPSAAASRPTSPIPSSAAASRPTWPCSNRSTRPSDAWRPTSRTPRRSITPPTGRAANHPRRRPHPVADHPPGDRRHRPLRHAPAVLLLRPAVRGRAGVGRQAGRRRLSQGRQRLAEVGLQRGGRRAQKDERIGGLLGGWRPGWASPRRTRPWPTSWAGPSTTCSIPRRSLMSNAS